MTPDQDQLAEAIAARVLAALDSPGDDDDLLSLAEVGRMLGGLSVRSVRDMVNGRDGRPAILPSVKVGPSDGARKVRRRAVKAYIAEREAAG